MVLSVISGNRLLSRNDLRDAGMKITEVDPSRSTWRAYTLSLLISVCLILAATAAAWLYHQRSFGHVPLDIFVKDYVPGYAPLLALIFGVPVAVASSIALVLLAMATIDATTEAPRLEAARQIKEDIRKIWEIYLPLTIALNGVEEAVVSWNKSSWILDTEGDDDETPSILKGRVTFADATSALKRAVEEVCRSSELALRQPLVAAELVDRLPKFSAFLMLKTEMASIGTDLHVVMAYPTFCRRLPNRAPASGSRFRSLLTDDVDSPDAIRQGALLAIAGAAHLEIARTEDAHPINHNDDEGEYRIETAEQLLSAAFLHDLTIIIPTAADIANSAMSVAVRGDLKVQRSMIDAEAERYDPRRFLSASLISAACEFKEHAASLRSVVGKIFVA